ncbi:hypothetical protein M5689_010535 [Euphorbia peplus]|nr:hypothetical protein M5689_010535 [Euphorbia peplus]
MVSFHFQAPLFYFLSLIFLSYRLVNASLISHTHTQFAQSPTATTNQTDVHDIMPLYGLPPGLIPDNVASYKLQDSGNFVIRLNSPCYVQFDRLVYYGEDIRGKLSYGVVSELSGIQAKKYFFWVPVTQIETSEAGEKIRFSVGPFSETFPVTRFAEIPACGSGSKVSMRNALKQVLYDSI